MTNHPFSFFYAFANLFNTSAHLIHDRNLKPEMGRRQVPVWGGDCEAMRLLGLEGEYLSFLLDMEVELGLLRHVLGCSMCLETIKGQISGEGESDLGTIGELFDDAMGVNVVDLDDLVERRISQRIEQLERLKKDADLELEDLRRNLEPLIHHDR